MTDRYTLVESIGAGATGQVGKYLDNSTNQIVVIKKISRTDAAIQELNVLELLDCRYPNLLCLLDVFSDSDGHTNLVYEYLDDPKDLDKCIFVSRDLYGWGTSKILRVMHDICVGLKNLHDNGILHRDLKPLNIVIRGNEIPVIIDYDMSCVEDDCIAPFFGGTYRYMAPEFYTRGSIGSAVDIYALGVTFYEMLTNRRATTIEIGKRQHSTLVDMKQFPLFYCREYTSELTEMLAGMLLRDSGERWTLDFVMEAIVSCMHSSREELADSSLSLSTDTSYRSLPNTGMSSGSGYQNFSGSWRSANSQESP
jgi:serine/threonine protein kinase